MRYLVSFEWPGQKPLGRSGCKSLILRDRNSHQYAPESDDFGHFSGYATICPSEMSCASRDFLEAVWLASLSSGQVQAPSYQNNFRVGDSGTLSLMTEDNN
jgi:hypothetical protein